MTSRERLIETINHRQPDKVVVDFGGSPVSGISCSTIHKLRQNLGHNSDRVEVQECMQMLGKLDNDMREFTRTDVVGLWKPTNNFGLESKMTKQWTMPDGTPVYMPEKFEYDIDEDGSVLVYPQGNRNYLPSAKMAKTGHFFDGVDRAGPMDDDDLDAKAHYDLQYGIFTDDTLRFLEEQSIELYNNTQYGVIGVFGAANFGDAAALPGISVLEPKGIRNMEDFMMAHILYPEYIEELFEMHCERAIENLALYKQAVGDRIQVILSTATDFGSQNGELISPDLFRKLYKPYISRVNSWIHNNTNWKTFMHSCGSIVNLLDDIVDSGIDILNPVQCSAVGMDANMLKDKYGDRLVFWGGGIDTQKTLPFGTPEEVEQEVIQRLKIFSKGGGYVFNTIHNVVANTPVENFKAMINAVNKFNSGQY